MKLDYSNVGRVYGDEIIKELQLWQSELIDDDLQDAVTYATLETIIDIIVSYAEV